MDELIFGEEVVFSNIESPEKIRNFQKALSVGYGMEPSTQTGYGAVRNESLDRVVAKLIPTIEDATFYKAIKKDKAYGTVEEFASADAIGSAGFYAEGGLPEEYDEDIRRLFAQVRYVGAIAKVPYPAVVTRSLIKAVEAKTEWTASAIIRSIDQKMWFGDASKNYLEWDGYLKQFNDRVKNKSTNVIDLRGKRLTPEIFNEAGATIKKNYGNSQNISAWTSVTGYQGWIDELLKNRRLITNEPVSMMDINAERIGVGFAKGKLNTDIFLEHKGQTYLDAIHPKLNTAGTAFAPTHEKAPAALDGGSCSLAVSTGATQMDAGTYDYAFVAANKFGCAAAFEIVGTAVTSDQIVTFTVADNGSPAGQEASSIEVYRKLTSETGLENYKFLASYAIGDTKVDDGSEIPGTSYAFIIDWNFKQVIQFKQLLPMMKMPLATVTDSLRWLQKQYAVPILKNPNKVVVLKNVGLGAW